MVFLPRLTVGLFEGVVTGWNWGVEIILGLPSMLKSNGNERILKSMYYEDICNIIDFDEDIHEKSKRRVLILKSSSLPIVW